jgi:hypothetical protein
MSLYVTSSLALIIFIGVFSSDDTPYRQIYGLSYVFCLLNILFVFFIYILSKLVKTAPYALYASRMLTTTNILVILLLAVTSGTLYQEHPTRYFKTNETKQPLDDEK